MSASASDPPPGNVAGSDHPPFKAPHEPLAPGDRCPNFLLPDVDGAFHAFYERVHGRAAVMLFLPAGMAPAILDGFAARAAEFAAAGYDLFAVLAGDVAFIQRETARIGSNKGDNGIVLLADPKGAVTRGYAAGARLNPEFPCCFLIDGNQRLLARRNAEETGGAALAEWALRSLVVLAPAVEPEMRSQLAPVLILPNVLDEAMCRALIGRWETEGAQEGTVTSVVDGEEVERVHDAIKRRRDHAIQETPVLKALAATIGRRIAPELVKAFHFEAFRFDRFNITCYDSARGDYFRAHRDNESASTSDRRFAISLNLNDDFEGGELLFPEYGPHRYALPAGAAVIFSCSLLHEALPVTKGKRYTLLSFLSTVPQDMQPPANAPQRPAPDSRPAPRATAPAAAPTGGFNPGGFNPGAPASPASAGGFKPGAPASPDAPSPDAAAPGGNASTKEKVPFSPGMPSKNGITRAGD